MTDNKHDKHEKTDDELFGEAITSAMPRNKAVSAFADALSDKQDEPTVAERRADAALRVREMFSEEADRDDRKK